MRGRVQPVRQVAEQHQAIWEHALFRRFLKNRLQGVQARIGHDTENSVQNRTGHSLQNLDNVIVGQEQGSGYACPAVDPADAVETPLHFLMKRAGYTVPVYPATVTNSIKLHCSNHPLDVAMIRA
jgi:hypothetical protein